MSVRAMSKKPEKSGLANERLSGADKRFYFINGAILLILFLLVLLPILSLFANSFSDSNAVAAGKVTFWPLVKGSDNAFRLGVSVDGFKAAFKNSKLLNGYWNTLIYTVSGTVLNLVLTILAAYPLSRSDMPGKNKIMMLFAFTMIFNAGMLPSFDA